MIVTEKGFAINIDSVRKEMKPRNEDILVKCQKSNLPVYTIEELRKKVLNAGGKDIVPNVGDEIIGLIKYIDGTVLDKVNIVKQ